MNRWTLRNIRKVEDQFKSPNISLIGIPKKKRTEKHGGEEIFKETLQVNFPGLKNTTVQFETARQVYNT